jgi:hypothetical protein
MLVTVVLLGACGDSTASSTRTTVRNTTTKPAVSTGVPTTTVVASATDPATLGAPTLIDTSTVGLRAIGAITFGMSIQDAEKAGGTRLLLEGAPAGVSGCQVMRPERAPTGIRFSVVKGAVARVDVNEGPVKTKSGAGISTTVANLQKIYPANLVPTADGRSFLYVPKDAVDADYRVVFDTDGTKVTSYRAGKVPTVLAAAPC